MSLYNDLIEAGVRIDNHESDLYCLDCEKARDILKHYPEVKPQPFTNQTTKERWLDLPFKFDPYWQAKANPHAGYVADRLAVRAILTIECDNNTQSKTEILKRETHLQDLIEVAAAVLEWAKTPGNHGGNPYLHEFVRKAQIVMDQVWEIKTVSGNEKAC